MERRAGRETGAAGIPGIPVNLRGHGGAINGPAAQPKRASPRATRPRTCSRSRYGLLSLFEIRYGLPARSTPTTRDTIRPLEKTVLKLTRSEPGTAFIVVVQARESWSKPFTTIVRSPFVSDTDV